MRNKWIRVLLPIAVIGFFVAGQTEQVFLARRPVNIKFNKNFRVNGEKECPLFLA